jgi:hypothetical protein
MGLIDNILSETPPNECIYHYTSQQGFLGIVEDGEIWATHIDYLNDRSEFTYTMEKTKAALQRRREHIASKQGSIEGDLSLIDKLEEKLAGTQFLKIYVCSFSSNGNLLSMWRGYCPGGKGYSIGFDSTSLVDRAKKQGFYFGKCRYLEKEQEDIIETLIDEALKDLKENSGDSTRRETLITEPDPLRDFRMNVLTIAPLLKDLAFQEENEWRLISRPKLITQRQKQEDFRDGYSVIVPYFKIKLVDNENDHLPIKKVFVGPGCDKSLGKKSVEAILWTKGVESVQVETSKIPYSLIECEIRMR